MPKIELTCAACGAAFSLFPSQMTRGRGQFCSKACANRAMQRGSTLQCAMCDTEFYRSLSEQDVGEKLNQFCSRECYFDWRAEHRSPDTYLKDGRVHAHRVVAAAVLGRPLLPGEIVHHIDLNKQNNHPSNLAVLPDQATHVRCHAGGISADELRRYVLQPAAA